MPWKRSLTLGPRNATLSGIAATSARNAWTVGNTASGRALVLHWNGRAWNSMPIQVTAALSAVTAISGRNAWAVGSTSLQRTVMLHWNGRTWKRIPIPDPGKIFISDMASTSAGNVWGVGLNGLKTAIIRWDGRQWRQVPSPSPPGLARLFGITAATAMSTWAVGTIGASEFRDGLILHWNGARWTRR